MNEQQLQQLVARARDEEGALRQPPPDLLDRARTAARRRRGVTLAAGCAVAAVIVAAVAVPRLVGDDGSDPGRDESALDAGELIEHGGPCPTRLPTPTDDDQGHGFGTSTPAEQVPRFGTPDSAWVCQYRPDPLGDIDTSDGWGWSLNHTPRRLDADRLGEVKTSLQDITLPPSSPYACTEELGPRWLLVTSTGGDLTGIVVDGYGCGDVRLTDDPFRTAPGDPQDGGTVPGVLTAPGLRATLEDWWNTSTADVGPGPAPDQLRVTCTDDGPSVDTSTVAAGPAGVELVVDSTMTHPGSYLTYSSEGPSGGDRLDQMPSPAPYAFPPGTVTLGCASPPDMDDRDTVSIEVVDPYGYWRTSTLADQGCAPGGAQPSWAVGSGSGPTAQGAVDDLLDKFTAETDAEALDYTAESAPTGYSGSSTQTWVGSRRGVPAFSILVTRAGTGFTASPDAICGRA